VISQIGFGFVGSALNKSFSLKSKKVKIYDKYKNLGSINDIIDSKICFFCLPTPFVKKTGFDKSAIIENLDKLENSGFQGLVVIKSTIEIGTTKNLSKKYSFDICHNPEFLTERTAFEDFHDQKHIVLGKTKDSDLFNSLTELLLKIFTTKNILC
jgi:UDPglucose 6-dehydrogenase